MNYCSGHIRYLIAIKELHDLNDTVRCVNISRHLGVSRPSVSKMLKCLVNSGFVHENFCQNVELTDEGKAAVSDIFDKFSDTYIFFRRFLKLPPDEAHEQAVRFISEFPTETCERLKTLVRRTLDKRK